MSQSAESWFLCWENKKWIQKCIQTFANVQGTTWCELTETGFLVLSLLILRNSSPGFVFFIQMISHRFTNVEVQTLRRPIHNPQCLFYCVFFYPSMIILWKSLGSLSRKNLSFLRFSYLLSFHWGFFHWDHFWWGFGRWNKGSNGSLRSCVRSLLDCFFLLLTDMTFRYFSSSADLF